MFGISIAIGIGASILAIIYGLILIRIILKKPTGNKKMIDIAKAISDGAKTHLNRQYFSAAVVAIVFFVVILYALDWRTALGFIIGAILSAVAGYVGVNISVRSNIRTAETSRQGLNAGLAVAFQSGTTTGMFVAGLALLSITGFYAIFRDINALIGLGLGGSLISIFTRLGGGIFAKGADVGTDLVAKVESKIPEDDPRNPGVIADIVGDNVGDCAGTTADLFETYVVTTVVTMLIGSLAFSNFENAVFYPLILGAIALISSIIGSFFIHLGKPKNIFWALYKNLFVASILAAIGFYFVTRWLMANNQIYNPNYLYFSSLIGLVATALLVILMHYYTSKNYSPVKSIIQNLKDNTSVITGLALSMRSTALPALIIVTAILGAYYLAGIYGIAIVATSMLSLVGIIVAIDSYGPIVDNACGIAKMADLPEDVLTNTNALDTVGNTIKAVTKIYAIASASLVSILLFSAYVEVSTKTGQNLSFSLSNPDVIVGLFIGGLMPYYFGSLVLEAVGKASHTIIQEIKTQFRLGETIAQTTIRPDYKKAVNALTQVATSQMILPVVIVALAPILVGLAFGPVALGGMLIGTIVTGLFMAISMTTGGAAWDNAKKNLENTNLNNKNNLIETATIGDIVGDSCKDAVGPAINPMVKVINIIALLIVPFVATEISLLVKVIIVAVALIAMVTYMLFGNGQKKKVTQ